MTILGFTSVQIVSFVGIFAILIYSVVLHEIAHGYAAYKCGDDTAFLLGRLSLNPIKHIDPFMTIILPIALLLMTSGKFIFGGAKPVPVRPHKYRNPVRDDIFVSSAGVMVNFLLAIFFAILLHVLFSFAVETDNGFKELNMEYYLPLHIVAYGMFLNLILGVFNLLPIPPLDGSHLFKYLLPMDLRIPYQRIGFFGLIILVLFIRSDFFSSLLNYCINGFIKIMGLDPYLITRVLF